MLDLEVMLSFCFGRTAASWYSPGHQACTAQRSGSSCICGLWRRHQACTTQRSGSSCICGLWRRPLPTADSTLFTSHSWSYFFHAISDGNEFCFEVNGQLESQWCSAICEFSNFRGFSSPVRGSWTCRMSLFLEPVVPLKAPPGAAELLEIEKSSLWCCFLWQYSSANKIWL